MCALPTPPNLDFAGNSRYWIGPTADDRLATGSYAMVGGTKGPDCYTTQFEIKTDNSGMFMYKRTIQRKEIPDGLSRTIFVGEATDGHAGPSICTWALGNMGETICFTANPINIAPEQGITWTAFGATVNAAFSSKHRGGAQFVFGDGHVEFLSDNIDLPTFKQLSTRNFNFDKYINCGDPIP